MYARSEYHTEIAKVSFDKVFDLTAGVYFNIYNIYDVRSTSKFPTKQKIPTPTIIVEKETKKKYVFFFFLKQN